MRRLAAVIAAGTVAAVFAPSVGAEDRPSQCPDQMVLFPAAFVEQGEQKDRNANGLVCAKPAADGRFHGGPDDMIDDVII